MHCEIGGTQGPLGYVNALCATRLVHWLILVAPSCLRSHNARYIMLKSLINATGWSSNGVVVRQWCYITRVQPRRGVTRIHFPHTDSGYARMVSAKEGRSYIWTHCTPTPPPHPPHPPPPPPTPPPPTPHTPTHPHTTTTTTTTTTHTLTQQHHHPDWYLPHVTCNRRF